MEDKDGGKERAMRCKVVLVTDRMMCSVSVGNCSKLVVDLNGLDQTRLVERWVD